MNSSCNGASDFRRRCWCRSRDRTAGSRRSSARATVPVTRPIRARISTWCWRTAGSSACRGCTTVAANKDDQYEQLSIHEGVDVQGSSIFSPQNAAPPAGKCRSVTGFPPKISAVCRVQSKSVDDFSSSRESGTWYDEQLATIIITTAPCSCGWRRKASLRCR